LEAAIKVLAGAGETRGFLETMKEAQLLSVVAEVRGVLQKPTALHSVGNKELMLVKQFVERPEDFIGSRSGFLSAAQITNNPFGDYAPQSTQIQGILKGMYDAFAAGLEKANAEEADAQKSFDELMVVKEQELATLQSTLDHQQLQLATKTNSLAERNEKLDDTKAQLDADEKLFAETKTGCKEKAGEWSERSRLRTEELAGVGQAIGILTDPNSVKVFTNSTTSFVQIASVAGRTGDSRVAVYARVSKLAQQFNSLSLARLAVQVMSGGHFDAVIASIDQMIAALRKEEQEDIDHRDRCQQADVKNNNDKQDLGHAINKADATTSVLASEETTLTNEVGTLEGAIAHTQQEVRQALNMRNEEVGEFQQILKDDADAIALLDQTIVALTRFYKSNRIQMSLMASNPTYSDDPDKAPETTWSESYGGRKSETHGVVAIIEMIKEDIEKEMKTARQDDASSQKQFEKQRTALQETMNAQVALKLATEKELSNVEAKLADTAEYKAGKVLDLDAETQLGSAITADCSWVDSHFDSRRTKRKAEIDGLNQAKGFLAGVDAGV